GGLVFTVSLPPPRGRSAPSAAHSSNGVRGGWGTGRDRRARGNTRGHLYLGYWRSIAHPADQSGWYPGWLHRPRRGRKQSYVIEVIEPSAGLLKSCRSNTLNSSPGAFNRSRRQE